MSRLFWNGGVNNPVPRVPASSVSCEEVSYVILCKSWNMKILVPVILIPRGRTPFGQHQESPLAAPDFLSMHRVPVVICFWSNFLALFISTSNNNISCFNCFHSFDVYVVVKN